MFTLIGTVWACSKASMPGSDLLLFVIHVRKRTSQVVYNGGLDQTGYGGTAVDGINIYINFELL